MTSLQKSRTQSISRRQCTTSHVSCISTGRRRNVQFALYQVR
jgi:hypothetical protein